MGMLTPEDAATIRRAAIVLDSERLPGAPRVRPAPTAGAARAAHARQPRTPRSHRPDRTADQPLAALRLSAPDAVLSRYSARYGAIGGPDDAHTAIAALTFYGASIGSREKARVSAEYS